MSALPSCVVSVCISQRERTGEWRRYNMSEFFESESEGACNISEAWRKKIAKTWSCTLPDDKARFCQK